METKYLNKTILIRQHLDEGYSITAFEALKLFGTTKLAYRMRELKVTNYPFIKEMIDVGNGKRIAQYKKKENKNGL